MTLPQVTITAILCAALAMFVWGRWRYDVVAFAALMATAAAGLVPVEDAFLGFGHPATITVAAVLVISRGLANSGAVERLTRLVSKAAAHPTPHVAVLGGFAGGLSAVMNNVGALALLMPVALQSAAKVGRAPSVILMPLSFASILGGLVTMIGTPPNIIVATFRGDLLGAPFGMFDFSPVGATVAACGIAFVALVGWRLIPEPRRRRKSVGELLAIEDYVTELEAPEGSAAVGQRVADLEDAPGDYGATVIGLIRGERRRFTRLRHETVRAGDILVIEADPEGIDRFAGAFGLKIVGTDAPKAGLLASDEMALAEGVVTPGSRLDGRTADALRLGHRYGILVLAVSRQGQPFRERLRAFRFRAGDVLLLRGEADDLPEVMASLGCLPLAGRDLAIGRRHLAGVTVAVFAAAVLAGTVGALSLPVALATAALAVVALGVVPVREVYDAVDWPVIVLLGSMIPVAAALETTGTVALISEGLLAAFAGLPAWSLLVVVIVLTMTLSDVMNNAATAVVMAPLAAGIAAGLGVSADPFLMAVAVGASCAFLTPIGHQNNTLVMGPGGYAFGDYWRMGLPLEALVVAVSVPMILLVWPF